MTLRRRYRAEAEGEFPTGRLEALADGVFAIVMTLLVLELGVPAAREASSGAVAEALREMWPEFLIYGLSFLVLGVFWLIHKTLFDSILLSDMPLVWLNVVYLMVTALLPFTTALVGEFRDVGLVAFVYGLNLALAFGAATAIFTYAFGGNRLIDEDTDPALVRGGSRMGIIYVAVMIGAAAISFASAEAAYVVYGVIVLGFMAATMIGRWESVMVWSREGDEAG
jgi:uncharacterized membrane protein